MRNRMKRSNQSSKYTKSTLDSDDITLRSLRPLSWNLGLLADFGAGVVSWTVFLEIIKLVWYFPLDYMDITGYELICVAYFSSTLLGITFIRRVVDSHPGTIRMLSLVSLIPFWLPEQHELLPLRALLLAVGLSFDQLSLFSAFFDRPERRERASVGWFLSFIGIFLLRFRHLSVNRIWTSMFTNSCAILLGIFSAAWFGIERSTSLSILEQQLKIRPTKGWLYPSLAFGSSLFLFQLIGGSYSVLGRWSDQSPNLSFFVTITAICVGFLTSDKVTRSSVWLSVGLTAGIIFWWSATRVENHTIAKLTLLSGALLIMFVTSLLLRLIHEMSLRRLIGRSLGVAMFVWFLSLVVSVYVVAYKFCPGGFLLREANSVLLLPHLFFIALMYKQGWNDNLKFEFHRKQTLYALVFMLAVTIPTFFSRSFYGLPKNGGVRKDGSIISPFVFDQIRSNASFFDGSHEMRAGIWTIHFGYDKAGLSNFHQLRDELMVYKPHFFGLLETDLSRIFFGNTDVVDYLANELNMYSDFGPATGLNTWGCALLSAYPIVSSHRILLPSPEGELACLIDALIDVGNGKQISVLVSHFGNTEDALDRKLQSETLRDIAKSKTVPIIVLSYLTTLPVGPKSQNLQTILASGLVDPIADQFDHQGYRRYCQYILTKNLNVRSFQRLPDTNSSDTELQLLDFSMQ